MKALFRTYSPPTCTGEIQPMKQRAIVSRRALGGLAEPGYRLGRQDRLLRNDPVPVPIVKDEQALRGPAGGPRDIPERDG